MAIHNISSAIDAEVARYVVSVERYAECRDPRDIRQAHLRYGAIRRLRASQWAIEHPLPL